MLESVVNLFKKRLEGGSPPAILQTIGSQFDDLPAISADPSGAGIDVSWAT